MLKTPEARITEICWCFLAMHFGCKEQSRYKKEYDYFHLRKGSIVGPDSEARKK
jgi:hypothetical protein